jgi:hypothetical protein
MANPGIENVSTAAAPVPAKVRKPRKIVMPEEVPEVKEEMPLNPVKLVRSDHMRNKVYTITYGDVAENHARMQKIGEEHANGYSLEKMMRVYERLTKEGLTCEMYSMKEYIQEYLDDVKLNTEDAYLLVIRKGVQHVLDNDTSAPLVAENDALKDRFDKKALMKGKVQNKKARWNLCFADFDQEPDYASGKGTIVAWEHIPLMSMIREKIRDWTEEKELLNGEANYYYDLGSGECGIGYHGDAERKKVFAVRMGSMPIYYQWFHKSKPVGPRLKFDLFDGDMYIMSEKAVGKDWMSSSKVTLRHAAGSDKYTVIKVKNPKK